MCDVWFGFLARSVIVFWFAADLVLIFVLWDDCCLFVACGLLVGLLLGCLFGLVWVWCCYWFWSFLYLVVSIVGWVSGFGVRRCCCMSLIVLI